MRVGVVAVVVLGMAAASLATGDHDVGHGDEGHGQGSGAGPHDGTNAQSQSGGLVTWSAIYEWGNGWLGSAAHATFPALHIEVEIASYCGGTVGDDHDHDDAGRGHGDGHGTGHDGGHGAHRSAGEGWKTVWSGTLSSNQGEWVGLYLPRSDADAPNHYRLSWGGDFEAPNTGDTARGGADQILWWLVNGGNAGDYPFAWRSRQGGPPAVPPDLGQSCPRMVTAPAL